MAAQSLNAALESGLARLDAELARVSRRPGVEAVHDARVAARRLRALLRGLEPWLNPVLAQQLRFELRAVGRILGPLRDADVRRATLVPSLRTLLRADPGPAATVAAGVEAFVATLDAERMRERESLREVLKSAAWGRRLERLRALFASESLVLPGRETVDAVLAPEIERRWRRLQRDAQRDVEDRERLHRLRIHAKTVRYLLEHCAASSTRRGLPALDLARRAQNTLGDLHDLRSLGDWLQGAAVPPAVLAAWLGHAAQVEDALRRRARKLARELKKLRTITAAG